MPNQTNSIAGVGVAVMAPIVIGGASQNICPTIPGIPVISTVTVAPVIVVSIVVAAIVVSPIVVSTVVSIPTIVISAVVIAGPAVVATRSSTAPLHIERVAFRPALGILNMNDSRSAIRTRIANQIYAPPPINAAEAEIADVSGNGTCTLEAVPGGRLSGQRMDSTHVTADFNVGRLVYVNFDCAFTTIAVAASADRGSA